VVTVVCSTIQKKRVEKMVGGGEISLGVSHTQSGKTNTIIATTNEYGGAWALQQLWGGKKNGVVSE